VRKFGDKSFSKELPHNLYSTLSTSGHAAYKGKIRNAYEISIQKAIWRSRHRPTCKDNIKMGLS
jgi:hypothetical protein